MTKKKASKKAAKRSVPKPARRPKPDSPPSPLQAYFERAGVLFGQTNSSILRKLQGLMGKDRCEAWKELSHNRHHGLETEENEYSYFRNAAELNTLFSLQSRATLAVCEWLCKELESQVQPGCRLGDLGCGGGILAGWLALQYPACSVVGFDALPTLLAAAAETQQAANLKCVEWDYAQQKCPVKEPCDLLVSCFGIDFPPWTKPIHPETVETLRAGDFYQTRKTHARHFFRGWRSAIADGGSLLCVLRIPWDIDFLATVDAAHEESWEFQIAASMKLTVGKEYFPAMVFKARESPQLPEDDLLRHWADKMPSRGGELYGTQAIIAFRSLPEKQTLKESTHTEEDGESFWACVAVSSGRAFQFTHGTSGMARLVFLDPATAGDAELWFPPCMPDMDWYGAF